MQEIVKTRGDDYRLYTPEKKKTVASAASLAVTVKSVLDTPILSEDGSLTEASAVLEGDLTRRIREEFGA